MQQFKGKFKNVPTDAPQVCSSTNPVLNRDQSLSVQDKVRTLNNLDVDLLQHKGGLGLRVPVIAYVLNQRGKPLMPCSARKARILLKKGEAKVVRINPFFVIQLTKATGEQTQICSLGIDSGYNNIGFSAITDKKEILSGVLALDKKTSKRLLERKMYRKYRRNKTWYRKRRYKNRKRVIGSLCPSLQRRFNTHVTLINKIKSILPINKISIETGKFNIQKKENPSIKGIQYQQGPLFGYLKIKKFLIDRESKKCQICGDTINKENCKHHILNKKDGGSNREKNLALVHEKCHKKFHKDFNNKLLEKECKSYKQSTFMEIFQHKIKIILPDCNFVHGRKIAAQRKKLYTEKSHYNDAFIIAGGKNQIRHNFVYLFQKHRNNRVLQLNRKGFKILIRQKRYSLQPYDLVFMKMKNI